jgi:hypothetical protein
LGWLLSARLANLRSCPLDRLSRYEAALRRQACQIMFTLPELKLPATGSAPARTRKTENPQVARRRGDNITRPIDLADRSYRVYPAKK